jgi:hypothetical protein
MKDIDAVGFYLWMDALKRKGEYRLGFRTTKNLCGFSIAMIDEVSGKPCHERHKELLEQYRKEQEDREFGD